jgi:hypothetical protein
MKNLSTYIQENLNQHQSFNNHSQEAKQVQEQFEQIDEAGILDIVKSMKNGDLIELVSAITSTEDFAKSAAKREIVNQLNKRGLLPSSVANLADKFFKYQPLFKKVF